MAKLGENCYGKSRVRLSRITRSADQHDFNEWTVCVRLHGDFESSFTEADNSKILPTDTMKNTVYSIARDSSAATIEEFAMELGDYLLNNNPQVSKASIEIEEKNWKRLKVDGEPDATTFKLGGPELQTAHAVRDRNGSWVVISGVDGLTILRQPSPPSPATSKTASPPSSRRQTECSARARLSGGITSPPRKTLLKSAPGLSLLC